MDNEEKEYLIDCCEEARKLFHKMLHKKIKRKEEAKILFISKALLVLGQHTVNGCLKGKEKDMQEVEDAKEIYEASEEGLKFIEDLLGNKIDFAIEDAHWKYDNKKRVWGVFCK